MVTVSESAKSRVVAVWNNNNNNILSDIENGFERADAPSLSWLPFRPSCQLIELCCSSVPRSRTKTVDSIIFQQLIHTTFTRQHEVATIDTRCSPCGPLMCRFNHGVSCYASPNVVPNTALNALHEAWSRKFPNRSW